MDVVWDPPGPGAWELDRSHFPGGTTPIVQALQSAACPTGMRRVFRELGTPADTLDVRFVNGFMYTRLRPLVRPDHPSASTPPLAVLKILTRLHPELRRRERRARRTLAERPWRAVVEEWHRERRAAVQQANLALQDVEFSRLTDAELVAHLLATVEHAEQMWELHFWLHGYDLGPIGFLLARASAWGVPLAPVIELLEGASPATAAPVNELAAIRRAIEATGARPTTLDGARAVSPEVAEMIDVYLRTRRAVLFSRYDVDGVTLGEVPDVVLDTIMASEERVATLRPERFEQVLSMVPAEHRSEFGERLTEARAAMDLRDDNGPNTAEWPLGLLRLALLELGRRLVRDGSAGVPEQAFELERDELVASLLPGGGPGAAALADRAERRRRLARLDPPALLGTPEPAPSLAALPAGLAEIVGAVQIVIEQLGMGGDRAGGPGLHGAGIGTSSYRGRACRAATAEEALERIEPGDVLVVVATTPAFNVVLSLAGAVVTTTGGPLCHAAVLARELGIPAVIGAAGALTLIGHGDEVEVDPLAGEVRLLAAT